MYIIRRNEGCQKARYLDEKGSFGSKKNARKINTYNEAQEIIDIIKDDPLYDKIYMEKCKFYIVCIGG